MSFNINQMLKNLVPKEEPKTTKVVELQNEKKEITPSESRQKNNFKHGLMVYILNSATFKGLTAFVLEDEFIGKRNVVLSNKLYDDVKFMDRSTDYNLQINDKFFMNNRLHKVMDIIPQTVDLSFLSNIDFNIKYTLGIIYVKNIPQIIIIHDNLTFDIVKSIKTDNDFLCEFSNVIKNIIDNNLTYKKSETLNKISYELLINSQNEFYKIYVYYFFTLVSIYSKYIEELNLGWNNNNIINISKTGISMLTTVNESKSKSLFELYIKLYSNLIELNIESYKQWLKTIDHTCKTRSIEFFVSYFSDLQKNSKDNLYNIKFEKIQDFDFNTKYITINNNIVLSDKIINVAFYTNEDKKYLVHLIKITTFMESGEKLKRFIPNETCEFKLIDMDYDVHKTESEIINRFEYMCYTNSIKYKSEDIKSDKCSTLSLINKSFYINNDKVSLYVQNINLTLLNTQTLLLSFLYDKVNKLLIPIIIENVNENKCVYRNINITNTNNLYNMLNLISQKIKTSTLNYSDKKVCEINLVSPIKYIFILNDFKNLDKGSYTPYISYKSEMIQYKEYVYDTNLSTSYKPVDLLTLDTDKLELKQDDFFYIDDKNNVYDYNKLFNDELELYKKENPETIVDFDYSNISETEKRFNKQYNLIIKNVKKQIRKKYKLAKVVGLLNKRVKLQFKEAEVSIPIRNLRRVTIATIDNKDVLVELFEITKNKECIVSVIETETDDMFNELYQKIKENKLIKTSKVQKYNCKDIKLKLPYVYFVSNLYKNDFYNISDKLLGLYGTVKEYENPKYVYILPEVKSTRNSNYVYIMRGINRGSSGFIVDEIKQQLTLYIPTLQKRYPLNTKYIKENGVGKMINVPFYIDDLFYYDVKLKDGKNVQINKITKEYIYGSYLKADIKNNIVLEPIKFKLTDIDQYLTGFQLNIKEEDSLENEFEDDIIDDNSIDYTEFIYTDTSTKLEHENKEIEEYLQSFNDTDRISFITDLSSEEKQIYVYIDKLFNMFMYKRAQIEMSIDITKLIKSITTCLQKLKKEYTEKTGNNIIEKDIKILVSMFVLYNILETGNHQIILNPKIMKIKNKLIHFMDIMQKHKFLNNLLGDIKHYQHNRNTGDNKYVLLAFFNDSWTSAYSNIESHKLYTQDKEILFYNCFKYVMAFYNNEIPLEYEYDTNKIPLFVLNRKLKENTKTPLLFSITIDEYLTDDIDLEKLTYNRLIQKQSHQLFEQGDFKDPTLEYNLQNELYKIDINNIKINYTSSKYKSVLSTFDKNINTKILHYLSQLKNYSLLDLIIAKPITKNEEINVIVNNIIDLYNKDIKQSKSNISKYEFPDISNINDKNYSYYIYDHLKYEKQSNTLFIDDLINIIDINTGERKEKLKDVYNILKNLYEYYFNKKIDELLSEYKNIENTKNMFVYIKNDYKNGKFALKRLLIKIKESKSNEDKQFNKKTYILMREIYKLLFGYLKYIKNNNKLENDKNEEEYEEEYNKLMFEMEEKQKNDTSENILKKIFNN